ncbi:hypothetical protein K469DRAFT_722491 [Zopfia rhizophila CBS 207.26]|uniref:Uncharacterized protein n=1 Tax=Zopfia rhizophila CBS 207.26 TaxID=1314779 RepID=A0A6A6EWQ5_9PEZI|nr:hypothetical protein K469DRAFT_722491 [Zopfia rhizophila CBS 207.26]
MNVPAAVNVLGTMGPTTLMMLWAWAGVPLGVYNISSWVVYRAALVIALRIAHDRDTNLPATLMAVLSAILPAADVLRHYWDIYVHLTARGISFIFVGIGAAGDLFSLVHGSELILWIGVFACESYYNLVPWVKKRLRRKSGEPITLHDLPSST